MRSRASLKGFTKLLVTGVAGLGLALGACVKDEFAMIQVQGTPVQDTTGYQPDCPIDSVSYLVSEQRILVTRDTLPVSGSSTLVHEYNDCQRLVRQGASDNIYGPLAAIFAKQNLNAEITRMIQLAVNNVTNRAVSVALVLVYDGTYNQLGMRRYFNCLYMWAEIDGTDTTRNAFMLPVSTNDAACAVDRDPSPLPGAAKKLWVTERRPTSPSYPSADFAQGSRWDMDPMTRKQYIVIGCRDAYCDITGDASFNASADRDNGTATPAQRKILRIKEWYDEQLLSEVSLNGDLVRSNVKGVFYPDPMLVSYQLTDFTPGTWRIAAYSYLSAHHDQYVTKLNFAQGSPQAPNRIELCRGTAEQCGVNPLPVNPDCAKGAADPWWARVLASGASATDYRYRCVILRKHPAGFMGLPGMVRWRWSLHDERGWISCPTGCCEVVGEM